MKYVNKAAYALAEILVVSDPCPKEIFKEFEPTASCEECSDNLACWIEWAEQQ